MTEPADMESMSVTKPSLIGQRRAAANSDSSAAYQQRRKEIAEAAVRVFNSRGYKGASLSAVAADMGVDRATLYYYFSSKDQLFDEITRSVIEENDALARRITESQMNPNRKLRELVTALMTSYAANYPLLFIYIREDLAHVSDKRSEWSREMRRLNRSIEQSVIGIIEQGFADGSFRRVGSARTVAYGILGMLNWTHRWFRPDRSESPEEIGKVFAEMILSGLESPY
ncbi:TetR/AcrR family transcriptional regulator [Sphingomonas sp. 1P06PA]|uniref:TetR/AcrR family transcriptional regulator n=1 Tax=Sphingomonas sp. 1P06PA TaxID=554121 RepID=UPI0039A4C466